MNDKVGFIETFKSVFMAFLGVQSSEKHERDFHKGSAGRFIVAGLILTVVFVLGMWAAVSLIMRLAGGS